MPKKSKTENSKSTQVKCPSCHAYFVEEGELCANCTEKKNGGSSEETEE